MKRYNNLIERIVCYDNILISIKEVIRGYEKRSYISSQRILRNLGKYCKLIENDLSRGDFRIHQYTEFTVDECGKERLIQSLPMYDRIILHAIMNILGREFMVRSFIRDTYSSIKGRGMMDGIRRLRKALKDTENTKYCLKLDLHKFYASVDHKILIQQLNGFLKDKILLKILTNLIHDYNPNKNGIGLPIGFHSSQYFGNFYLSGLDRYAKQDLKVKYYLRYCDDITILGKTKEELWEIFYKLKEYVTFNLHLTIKPNYQVFPVESRGIDFLGYVTKHNGYTRIRKRIKKKALRKLSEVKSMLRTQYLLGSLTGWLLNCDEHPNELSNLSKIIKRYKKDREKYGFNMSVGTYFKYLLNNSNIMEQNNCNNSSIQNGAGNSQNNGSVNNGNNSTGLAARVLDLSQVKSFSSLGIKQTPRKRMIKAEKKSTNELIGKEIIITDFVEDICTNKFSTNAEGEPIKKYAVEFIYANSSDTTPYKFITSAYMLIEALDIMKPELPVSVTITRETANNKTYLRFE